VYYCNDVYCTYTYTNCKDVNEITVNCKKNTKWGSGVRGIKDVTVCAWKYV